MKGASAVPTKTKVEDPPPVDEDVELAARTAAEPDAGQKLASGKVVAYVGTADVVNIDAAAWRNVNVKDQTKITWNRLNHFQVPVEQFTDDALVYLDEVDDRFVVKTITID